MARLHRLLFPHLMQRLDDYKACSRHQAQQCLEIDLRGNSKCVFSQLLRQGMEGNHNPGVSELISESSLLIVAGEANMI